MRLPHVFGATLAAGLGLVDPVLLAARDATLTPSIASRDLERTIVVAGVTRSYRVHLPPAAGSGTPLPVVLAFHGGGSNAAAHERFSGLSAKADDAGFVVVYPSGSGRLAPVLTWNGGSCCGYAAAHDVDDVAFVRALLDELPRSTPIDPRRVFATGMSNGAILAHRLGCELADRIAAIAPVAGPIGGTPCNPARPVPVIHFHGTADAFAPFAGGRGSRSVTGTDFESVARTIAGWARRNRCRARPQTRRERPRVADGTAVVRRTYAGCRDDAEVVLIEIEGGGHVWPGGEGGPSWLGPATGNVSANDAMWEFFLRHPMPGRAGER